jgi:CHAT domain-containing protein/Tfp pilus assembly protein PilF
MSVLYFFIALIIALLRADGSLAASQTVRGLQAQLKTMLHDADLGKALQTADALLEAAKEEEGEESGAYAAALSTKGAIILLQGRFAESESILERALALSKVVLQSDHPDLATALNNLGMQRFWTARYGEAEQLVRLGLEIRERRLRPGDPEVAESLNNLGHIYKYLGRNGEAGELLQRALKIYEGAPSGNDWQIAEVLQNLASVDESRGDYVAAGKKLLRALAIYKASLPTGNPHNAAIRNRLGINLFSQAKYKEAEPYFREAYNLQSASQQFSRITAAAILTDFGTNQMIQGRLSEARQMYAEALAIREGLLPPSHPDIARTLGNIAEIEYRSRNFRAALALLRRATAILSKRERIDERATLQLLRLVRTSWEIYASRPKDRQMILDEVFVAAQYAMRNDTSVTVERMAERFSARDPALGTRLKESADLDRQEAALELELAHALALPRENRTQAQSSLSAQLAKIESRKAEIDHFLKKSFSDYAELIWPKAMSISEAAATLRPQDVLLLIYPAYRDTYIWAVSREGVAWTRADVGTEMLAQWVGELRNELDDDIGKPFNLAIAHALYDKLLSGVSSALAGKKDLIVVAPAPLDNLPFHLFVRQLPKAQPVGRLPVEVYREADWLVRSYAVSVLPSVSSLTALKSAHSDNRERKPMIGFGNPIFDLERSALAAESHGQSTSSVSRGFSAHRPRDISRISTASRDNRQDLRKLPPLPDTEEELSSVMQFLGGDPANLKLGPDATEANVKQSDLSAYRVVYFATHGLNAGDLGLGEPALALTVPKAPSELDDGLLTGSEIALLKLDADWVVLSACNTASAENPGEGALSGLARSFFQAGARALLVSHWPVLSQAATQLVTSAFAELNADPSLSKAEALQHSMLKVLHDGELYHSDPRYWAPFIVVGTGGL